MPTKPTRKAKGSKQAVGSAAAVSVGQKLKSRRLERGLSLKEVELATRIRGRYLVAIEADRFRDLPHDAYSRGFIQSYARFLGLDGSAVVADFSAQRGRKNDPKLSRERSLGVRRLILTPRLLTSVGGAIIAVGVAAYLVAQLSVLTAPPQLVVVNPSRDQVLYGSLVTLKGSVNDGADVFVNSSPILVDGNGNFSDDIALQEGVNNIQISARNSLGKTTTIRRNVLAHVPKTDPASQLPGAPFSGVAVSVSVQGRASTVKVAIDGHQAFSGTMLPGTTQTFKGIQSVTISTTDGASTSLNVTNSQVAAKNLGSLAPGHSPRADFQFDRDTQFQ